MFISSFFGLNSQKPDKSKDRHSRRSQHREKPHHNSRHHHPRRRERSNPPEDASEGGFRDRDDEYDRRNPYPEDRRDHGRVNSHSRHEREPERSTLYDGNNQERGGRKYERGLTEDERDWRDAGGDNDDRDNDDERDGRQSERRTGGGCNRSPSLSRALHRQAGETAQDMRDRVDGHSRRRTKFDGEQVPRRSPSPGQQGDRSDRRSIPRRPRYTTTTSYQYPGGAMEDPAPRRLSKSATWPSEDPSRRSKPEGGRSHLRQSDIQDPSNFRPHRERNHGLAHSPPLASDDPIMPQLRSHHAASTVSEAYKSGLAGRPWSETQRSLFPGSRTVRLPAPGPVRLLSQEDWESKDLDQSLAREIAFTDLGLTTEQEDIMPYDQQDELARCYFPTLKDLDLRLKASKARSLSGFADIVVGMKEGYLRVLTHARQTDMLSVPDLETFQPANRPLYVAFAERLDDDFEKAKMMMRTRSAASASESMAETEELERSEALATRGLRKQYGWFGSHTAGQTTRKTYRYPEDEK